MANHNIVVIGVSTCGPIALKQMFTDLPPLNAACESAWGFDPPSAPKVDPVDISFSYEIRQLAV